MQEKTIVIATKNAGKAREFQAIFEPFGYQVKTLFDYPELPDVEETGKTFAENARLKAEAIAKALNCYVLADDSGLCVSALYGAPGIYSARYAGEPKSDARNNAKLLSEMAEVPAEKRQATFHCTLALAAPMAQRPSLCVSGELEGEIAPIPRGENGFGYDPLFFVAAYGKTMAELPSDVKNTIGHRRRAIDALLAVWEEWMAEEE